MSHGKRSCLVVAHGYGLNDPPSRQAATSLAQGGWKVTFLQGAVNGMARSETPAGVETREWTEPRGGSRVFRRVASWLSFRRAVRACIRSERPALVVAVMLHALAALPRSRGSFKLVSFIYDIPSLPDVGRLDHWLIRAGWRKLRQADLVWSSDRFKARWARRLGRPCVAPLVCHNCPPLAWVPEGPLWPRDPWLRAELRSEGAHIGARGGCVVLRAGGVGEDCGLEATIDALRGLPQDYLFLMLGRPSPQYLLALRSRIGKMGLHHRAFVWDHPSDEVWRRALLGADVGHLIHGPYVPGPRMRMHRLNSIHSSNRLFQYMAVGLPVLAYDDARLRSLFKSIPCFRVARLENLRAGVEEAFRELGADADLRKSLGEHGRRAFAEVYHWERQFGPVLGAIDRLFSGGRGVAP